jgi:fluoride exporter
VSAIWRPFIAATKGNDMNYLIVFVGSGIGGAARNGVGTLALRLLGPKATVLGTFSINVAGSFCMALVAGYCAHRSGLSPSWRVFLTTGIIGGFTTSSTFSLDAAVLYQRGDVGTAALYVIGSVTVSLTAFFAGLALVRI